MVYAVCVIGENLSNDGYKRLMEVYAPRHLPAGIEFQQAVPVAHMEHAITVGHVEGQFVRIHAQERTFDDTISAVKLFLVNAAKNVAGDEVSALEQQCFVPERLLPQWLALMSSTTIADFNARHPQGSETIQKKYVKLDGRLWRPAFSGAANLGDTDALARYERLACILIENTENTRSARHHYAAESYRENMPENIRKALALRELVPS